MLNPLLNELIKQDDFNLVSYDYKITELQVTKDKDDDEKVVGSDAEYSLDEKLLKFYFKFFNIIVIFLKN